ncbi:MAG: alpha/beta hydrolase [Candidatus Azobacteroides sp.]|nr:alpha/beta hydrolase [Candidatus Azobacteroides sp.]
MRASNKHSYFIGILLFVFSLQVHGQEIYNRYGFLLEQSDGRYILKEEAAIRKHAGFNPDEAPCDMYLPYKNTGNFLAEKEFAGCKTKRFVFKKYPGYELSLEADLPQEEGPCPYIIWIHGGGWHGGDLYGHKHFSTFLASHGIAGVRISYSLLSQGATFTDTWQDIQDAVGFIKEHAVELKLDTTNFGFAGHSAGGHLAAYAAMRTPGCKFLAAFNGIYDIRNVLLGYVPGKDHEPYFGTTEEEKEFASPVSFVHPHAPFCLLTYSSGDYLIDKEQIRSFEKELINRHIPFKTIEKEYYSHAGFLGTDLVEPMLLTVLAMAKQVFNE